MCGRSDVNRVLFILTFLCQFLGPPQVSWMYLRGLQAPSYVCRCVLTSLLNAPTSETLREACLLGSYLTTCEIRRYSGKASLRFSLVLIQYSLFPFA